MFIIIVVGKSGLTKTIALLIGNDHTVLKYGILSFLSANVINNIPMSALFSTIITSVEPSLIKGAVFASIIGSFLTLIGALARIMWNNYATITLNKVI